MGVKSAWFLFRVPIIILLITAVTVAQDEDAVHREDGPLQGDTFSKLKPEEIELLKEYHANLTLLVTEYGSLTMQTFHEEYRYANEELETPGMGRGTETVVQRRAADKRFRVDRFGKAGTTGALLIDQGDIYHLKRDSKTEKYFVTRTAREVDRHEGVRIYEWWVDAAYSFHIDPLSKAILLNRPDVTIEAVSLTFGEEGEELVEIRQSLVPQLSKPGDEKHDMPSRILYLDRERSWALKKAVKLGYVVGHPIQVRNTQRNTYQSESGPNGVPVFATVDYLSEERDLAKRNDDTAWKPTFREKVEITAVDFETPDVSRFEIQEYIPNYHLRREASRNTTPWLLILNGLLLLGVWYAMQKRRRQTNSASQEKV